MTSDWYVAVALQTDAAPRHLLRVCHLVVTVSCVCQVVDPTTGAYFRPEGLGGW